MTLPKTILTKIQDPETGGELVYNFIRADVLLENNKLKQELEKK
jgi:hypothetical protein